MAGVYWIGTDGNVWFKGSSGQVQNAGQAINASDKGFDTASLSAAATRIDDPNPKPTTTAVTAPAPTNPNNTAAAAAPAPKPDKSNDIALNNAGLGKADEQLNNGLASIDHALGGVMGQYDTETAANTKTYTDQTTSNTQSLQKNKQTAFVNAAQGRQGLFGTLASLGALNGDGISLANNAVKKGANDDLAGATDTYAQNQTTLDDSIGKYKLEDERRRKEAQTAAENAKTNARGETAKSKQSYLTNLSNDYAAMGNEGEARRYAGMAGDLFGEIAKSNVPNANIAYTGAAFTPASLSNYIAGADSTVVSATPTEGGPSIPGLVASPTKKKQQQLVGV